MEGSFRKDVAERANPDSGANFEEIIMQPSNLVVNRMEKSVSEFQGSSKSSGFDNVKNIIADKLHGAAERIGDNVSDRDLEFGTAKYGKQASVWLDNAADYIRKFDFNHADADIRKYVKQTPGSSLLIAGAVGLIIGSVLRRR